MKYKIKYLKIARDDLKELRDYLTQFYPSTTRNFLKELKKRADILKEMPFAYEQYHDDPLYRKMVVNDYLVFYHVDDEKRIVEIHRILHSSRDVKKYI